MMQRERSLPRRRTRQRTEPGHTPGHGVGRTKPGRCIPQTVFIRTSCTSYLHSPSTSTILPPCQHRTSVMCTFCGMPLRIPTSMLAIHQILQRDSKRTTQGMSPTQLNTHRGKSTLLLQFRLKNRHLNWRNTSNLTPAVNGH